MSAIAPFLISSGSGVVGDRTARTLPQTIVAPTHSSRRLEEFGLEIRHAVVALS
jgi:hypothetical protein